MLEVLLVSFAIPTAKKNVGLAIPAIFGAI
jgi:hypothetical protein